MPKVLFWLVRPGRASRIPILFSLSGLFPARAAAAKNVNPATNFLNPIDLVL